MTSHHVHHLQLVKLRRVRCTPRPVRKVPQNLRKVTGLCALCSANPLIYIAQSDVAQNGCATCAECAELNKINVLAAQSKSAQSPSLTGERPQARGRALSSGIRGRTAGIKLDAARRFGASGDVDSLLWRGGKEPLSRGPAHRPERPSGVAEKPIAYPPVSPGAVSGTPTP